MVQNLWTRPAGLDQQVWTSRTSSVSGRSKRPTAMLYVQVGSTSPLKPQVAAPPQNTDHDSGVDTFTRTMDQRSKHQHNNNINAVPKAIPVR